MKSLSPKNVVEKRNIKIDNSFRLVSQEVLHYTPPEQKQNLHPPKSWEARKYKGGTFEEASPTLSKALEQGYLVFWNERQFTRADMNLYEGLKRLEAIEENETNQCLTH